MDVSGYCYLGYFTGNFWPIVLGSSQILFSKGNPAFDNRTKKYDEQSISSPDALGGIQVRVQRWRLRPERQSVIQCLWFSLFEKWSISFSRTKPSVTELLHADRSSSELHFRHKRQPRILGVSPAGGENPTQCPSKSYSMLVRWQLRAHPGRCGSQHCPSASCIWPWNLLSSLWLPPDSYHPPTQKEIRSFSSYCTIYFSLVFFFT